MRRRQTTELCPSSACGGLGLKRPEMRCCLPGEQCGAHLVYRPQEEVQGKDSDSRQLRPLGPGGVTDKADGMR